MPESFRRRMGDKYHAPPLLAHFLPPSPGDKLLTGAHSAKIELLRFTDDDTGASDSIVQFEICGSLPSQADARQLLAALLNEFNRPAKGGEAHV